MRTALAPTAAAVVGYVNQAFEPRSLFELGEQGAWYQPQDTSTLFQDSAGTTPVTAVEQPVGLMLDKRLGLVPGSELVTNGDFSGGSTGWNLGTDWSVTGGAAVKVAGVVASISTNISVVAGTWYQIAFDVTRTAGTITPALIGGTTASGSSVSASGRQVQYIAAVTGNVSVRFSADASFAGSIDNVSVRAIPGNHAYQTTSTARPVLSARYNLLTYSEQIGNAAWSKTDTTVVDNSVTTPAGQPVSLLTEGSAGTSNVNQQVTATASVTLASSRVFKRGNTDWVLFGVADAGFSLGVRLWVNLASGTLGTLNTFGVATAVGGTITDLGNGFYRVTLNVSGIATATLRTYSVSAASDGSTTRVSNSTRYEGLADLRVANDGVGLPVYQRVAASTDYDTAGFPLYLRTISGANNLWMQTNSIDFGAGATNAPYGPELVTNGDFTTDLTGWSSSSGSTITWQVGGSVLCQSTAGSNQLIQQSISGLTVGRVYKITVDWSGLNQQTAVRFDANPWSLGYISTTGVLTGFITASTTSTILMVVGSAGSAVATISSISVKELLDSSLAPDKMTVVAGVRKLSDAASGVVIELGTSVDSVNGTFGLLAPGAATNDIRWRNRGTTTVSATQTSISAPVTAVLTGYASISEDIDILRNNNVEVASSTADQGTGNYGNYPLYLFRRGGTSTQFDGRFYGSIVRGALSSADQLTASTSWMNTQTKAY